MAFLIYFIIYFSCLCLSTRSKTEAINGQVNVWRTPSVYLMLIAFALIIGLRYMVGKDDPVYLEIVSLGEKHYYYDHLEWIPKKFVDLVHFFNLEFYWWFILMAFFQIYFIARAVRGPLVEAFPWVIFCFLVLYLAFYMNVVRQGAALSCFLCAATYAQERKLKLYFIFFFLAFLCHRSVIVWFPIYWLLNKELFPNRVVQYLILAASSLILPILIEKLLALVSPYLELFGYGHQADSFVGDEDIELGSGLGLILRYIRWGIIIAYYDKLKNYYGAEHFVLLYNLFFVGICFDYASVFIIIFARVFMYGSFMELIILPYLFNYLLSSPSSKLNAAVFISLLLMLVVSVVYPFISGGVEWNFVWNS